MSSKLTLISLSLILFFSLFLPKTTLAQCATTNCGSCSLSECTSTANSISTYCKVTTNTGSPSCATKCTYQDSCYCSNLSQLCSGEGCCNTTPGCLLSNPGGGITTCTQNPTYTPTPTPLPICSSSNCQVCATESNCTSNSCFWGFYNSSTTKTCGSTPACSPDHCDLCNTSQCSSFPSVCTISTDPITNTQSCTLAPPPTPYDPLGWLKDTWNWTVDAWNKFWSWLYGCFFKSYTIPTDPNNQQKNFTDYGIANNDNENTDNINAAENRTTSLYQQYYFKGRYMIDVINNVISDMPIAKVCNGDFVSLNIATTQTCYNFDIICLANCFVTDNQTFAYEDQNGTTIPITNYTTLINSKADNDTNCQNALKNLSATNFSHYQNIYLNFFRVPPNYSIATKNENATRVLRTPIPDSLQSQIGSSGNMDQEIKDQKAQLDKNFVPEGTGWSGLGSLRPQGW